MRLIAKIKDSTLLFKLAHELGTTFYKVLGNGEFEVVYFSGERIAYYVGKLSEEQIRSLEHSGWKVSEIVVNEVEGEVKIKQ